MNISKIVVTCALALVSVSVAHAQNYLYITGSTAFRGNVETALGGSGTSAIFDSGYTYGYQGTTANKQNCAIYKGTISGVSWIIKTAWSGSEGGIQTVSGAVPINFLSDACTTSTGGTSGLDDVTASGYTDSTATLGTTGNEAIQQVPDMAMADTAQAASQFNGVAGTTTYPAITESSVSPVGINVFKFIANKGSTLTGITSQQVRSLWAAGKLPMSLFTGLNADETSTVYATGRNPDSGTRVTELLETGYGTALSTVKQYQPYTSAGALNGATANPIVSLAPFSAGTVNGIAVAIANNGYSSGGNLAKSLNTDYSGTITVGSKTYSNTAGTHKIALIGYASSNDADGQITGGGDVELAFNGVSLGIFSDYNTATALTEGKYTFWSKEHCYYGNSEDSTHTTVINNIATAVSTQTGVVQYANMKVARSLDGAALAPNFTVY